MKRLLGSVAAGSLPLVAVAVLAVAVTASAASRTGSAGGRPLETAIVEPGPDMRRVRTAGARTVRIQVYWHAIAPRGDRPPRGFVALDPASPFYRWEGLDEAVKAAHAAGLRILLGIQTAPRWAQGDGPQQHGGAFRPDPAEYGKFARAAALRYSGRFEGLPRVRYWQAWNEPNLSFFLNPQRTGRRPASPALYRNLVNAFSSAVKSVHPDNLVVAGGLAPLGRVSERSVRPMAFMRNMLCVNRAGRRTCSHRTRFDVWSHHPYTTGGPTHRAFHRDDVALGDLPKMRRLLMAAYRAGNVTSPRAPLFWVTEFSWDSKPPDPRALPISLHARWVSEALYRMWSAGVTLVTWFTLEDGPYPSSPYQSGLYFRGFRPKPALQAFRFPFVAFRERGGGVLVWGRTPESERRRVVVEQQRSGRWQRVAVLSANRHGIFTGRVRTRSRGPVRAVLVAQRGRADASRPFSLVVPPDRYVRPFG